MYVIAGPDTKWLLMDETFVGWGGEVSMQMAFLLSRDDMRTNFFQLSPGQRLFQTSFQFIEYRTAVRKGTYTRLAPKRLQAWFFCRERLLQIMVRTTTLV